MRASRLRNSPQRSALACVASDAPTSASGMSALMFISARTERTAVTRSITQPISASASGSSRPDSAGHCVSASMPARAAPEGAVTLHSSSVTNGMNGCSSFRISSRTQAVMARVSVFCGPSAPCSSGFASSRYQSQKMFQTKR